MRTGPTPVDVGDVEAAAAGLQAPGGGRGNSRTSRREEDEVADFTFCSSFASSFIPVLIHGSPVADGGCSSKIWAMAVGPCSPLAGVAVKIEDEDKIVADDAITG